MNAPTSPDILGSPPKRGPGVRRINRNPLIVVFGVFVIVMGVVGYTIMEKSDQGAEMARQAERPKIDPATSEGVLSTAPVAGVIEAAPEEVPLEEAAPQIPAPAARPAVYQPAPNDGQVYAQQPTDSPYFQEWQEYRQAQSQARQARLQQQKTAFEAGSQVSFGNSATNTAGGGQTSEPGSVSAMIESQANQLMQMAQNGLNARNGMPHGGNAPMAGPGMGGTGGEADPNNALGKAAWISSEPNPANYLERTVQKPLSPYEIKTGTVIPGVMISGVNSDLPGQIIGQVSENVWDTATGRYLLIPQGARIVGTYDNQVSRGQRRVLVGWTRIIYPDGSSLDLPKMPGADQAGYAGFRDKVNNHTFSVFRDALLMSLFAAGVELSQPRSVAGEPITSQQVAAAEIGKQMGQAGSALIQRNAAIQPTIEIRPGYRFNIMVTRDMVLPPWQGNAVAAAR